MCEQWREQYTREQSCEGVPETKGQGNFTVKGKVEDFGNSKILFWAPNPPTYLNSYSGSGLPYPNATIAYENTVNKGTTTCKNGEFQFQIEFPNAYYRGLGTVYVPPCYHVKKCGSSKMYTFEINQGIPYRMLTYPMRSEDVDRESTDFYDVSFQGVRTQEQILRASSFPAENKMAPRFWGGKPPN